MSLQATTIELDEVRARLLSRPAAVTPGELLGVVIGRGARRMPGTDPGTHRTAVEVGRAILAEAGGLTGFVRTADDRLRERDGVGKVLACVLIAAAEVAARYHREPAIVGDPTLPARTRTRRTTREDDAAGRLFRDRSSVTEGELFAFLRPSWRRGESGDRLLLAASGLGSFLRAVCGTTLERFRLKRTAGCRMIAVAEIADRYDRQALRLAAGAAGLPLSMLHLAEHLLTALADRPQPRLMVHGAEMLRHARRIASGLTSGDESQLPDLELIRELLSESRPYRSDG
ncbi:MAG: hypothetical protein V3T72_20585 [Thermoanaerobaculia bacterium]